ncbi:dehydrogenase [Sphaerisporangium siamense]|uniref:SagB-type dehydrogenase family enzyme n=1 Tax=Sphaerisporangium siamense TaxID=795645 RepID=A0A7W7D3L2_9ACTN|nr:SagB family peptide dehydrogenase [Sphaerisporangium siamense]MBB4699481.1 SagB-type dehydrogenase family enzyme [Sphaerisporangium siamense]GII86894.1 dehydrogenase [Sphaerisporangium siamense]
MIADRYLVFRDGVAARSLDEDGGDGGNGLEVTLGDWGGLRLRNVRPAVQEALLRLLKGPTSDQELLRDAPEVGHVLTRLGHLVVTSLPAAGLDHLRVEPRTRDAAYTPTAIGPRTPVRLSRFAYLRARDGRLVVESPLSLFRVVARTPAARALLCGLAEETTAVELAGPDLPIGLVEELLAHLAGVELVERADAPDDPVLRQWEFHDLLFHSRSRTGRHDELFGGRFPHRGSIEPLPAVRPAPEGEGLALPRPDFEEIAARDPGLLIAMEARQSVRDYGPRPMALGELAEFLYRVHRVRGRYGPRTGDGMPYEGATLPWPCGGASYELSLYLTVRRCEGLEPGIYYYDPEAHRLHLVNAAEDDRETLARLGSLSTGGYADPDIVVTITSRFQRLSWKYQSIAYAVTLKHVGVLYQTMYLVATAMGLAPCGLGSGSLEPSSRILGLDWLRESAVGEFLLGSLPERLPPAEAEGRAPDWRPGNDPEWAVKAKAILRGEIDGQATAG